jgi:hypothetical protein
MINREELFEILEENKFCFVKSFAKVLKSDTGNFYVHSIDFNIISMSGEASDEEIDWRIKELEDLDVDQEGYYLIKVLFSTSIDYDDYRRWTVLEPEIIKIEFQGSIEEVEGEGEIKEQGDTGLFPF